MLTSSAAAMARSAAWPRAARATMAPFGDASSTLAPAGTLRRDAGDSDDQSA